MSIALAPGVLVAGRYRLESFLGAGGMGSVWAASHAITRRSYALKFLNAVHAENVDQRQRFLREAQTATAVEHPYVVRVHDVFEVDRALVMVMDLLRGETLGARLRRVGQLSLEEIARVLLPVAEAVGAAHARGVVHRDLKPDNVFLAGSEAAPDVKVLDFGIAKLFRDDLHPISVHTATGALLGTPCYMSPEQALAARDIDQRTDIWSFGAILYEALAGARPVEGENLAQVIRRLTEDGITPLGAIVPDLASDVAEIVARMLSHDREDRPSDLSEVRAVLEKYAPDVAVASDTRREPFAFDIAEASPNVSSAVVRRGGAAISVRAPVLALVVLTAVASLALVFRSSRTPPSTDTKGPSRGEQAPAAAVLTGGQIPEPRAPAMAAADHDDPLASVSPSKSVPRAASRSTPAPEASAVTKSPAAPPLRPSAGARVPYPSADGLVDVPPF